VKYLTHDPHRARPPYGPAMNRRRFMLTSLAGAVAQPLSDLRPPPLTPAPSTRGSLLQLTVNKA